MTGTLVFAKPPDSGWIPLVIFYELVIFYGRGPQIWPGPRLGGVWEDPGYFLFFINLLFFMTGTLDSGWASGSWAQCTCYFLRTCYFLLRGPSVSARPPDGWMIPLVIFYTFYFS